jgi:hypothetical protein
VNDKPRTRLEVYANLALRLLGAGYCVAFVFTANYDYVIVGYLMLIYAEV